MFVRFWEGGGKLCFSNFYIPPPREIHGVVNKPWPVDLLDWATSMLPE